MTIEQLIEVEIGHTKPIINARTSPAHLVNFIVLPLTIIMLIISGIRSETFKKIRLNRRLVYWRLFILIHNLYNVILEYLLKF